MAFEIMPWRSSRGGLRPWREMDDLFGRLLEEFPMAERSWRWAPAVDISENDGQVTMRAELPGLEAKDISVDVNDNVLTLRGEKKMEEEKKDERYYCRERFSGSFERSFRLPSGVDSEQVDARFKNGVLEIVMPKSEKNMQKKIEIKSA